MELAVLVREVVRYTEKEQEQRKMKKSRSGTEHAKILGYLSCATLSLRWLEEPCFYHHLPQLTGQNVITSLSTHQGTGSFFRGGARVLEFYFPSQSHDVTCSREFIKYKGFF